MKTTLSDGPVKICRRNRSIRKQGLIDWEGLGRDEWETEGREQVQREDEEMKGRTFFSLNHLLYYFFTSLLKASSKEDGNSAWNC